MKEIFERAEEIAEIEAEMITEGKNPFEDGVTNEKDEEDTYLESKKNQIINLNYGLLND